MHNKINIDFSNNKNVSINKFKSNIITKLRNAREIINNDDQFIELKSKLVHLLKETNDIKLVVSNNYYNIESNIYNGAGGGSENNMFQEYTNLDNEIYTINTQNGGLLENNLLHEFNEIDSENNIDPELKEGGYYDELQLGIEEIQEGGMEEEGGIEQEGGMEEEEEEGMEEDDQEGGMEEEEEEGMEEEEQEGGMEEEEDQEGGMEEEEEEEEEGMEGGMEEEEEQEETIEGDDQEGGMEEEENDEYKHEGGYYNNDHDNQTYLFDSNDSDEESLIFNKKNLSNKKFLNTLNVNTLKDIMRNNNMKLSKNGHYLKKNEMIKNIKKLYK